MARYLGGRILEIVPVALLISLAAFFLIHLVPGDPARVNLGVTATPERVEQQRHELGLDKPLPAQYWNFLSGAPTLDFGESISTREPVQDILSRRLGPSFLLVGYTILISLLIAVPMAMVAAMRRGTWIDRVIQIVPTVTYVMPAFWLGLLLVQIFSLRLGIFPTSGYGDTFPEHIRSLTLPALTLAMGLFPILVRVLRSSLIDTMGTEYVEAARARGLSDARVMSRYVLRNSVTSTVTVVGFVLGVLLSFTVIVEQIFAIPGIGSLLVESVQSRDFPVVQALTLIFGLTVLIASIVTDLVYALLDPRVRL